MRISAADLALLQFHAVAATDSLPKSLFPYTHGRRGLATYLVDDPSFAFDRIVPSITSRETMR